MNLFIVISIVGLLCETGYSDNCTLSVIPPDSKSGCCGHAVDSDRTSGSIARISEYPWMANVEYLKKNKKLIVLCSASLISGTYALSAANCFSRQAFMIGTPVNVRVGDYDLNNDGPDCTEINGGKICNDGAIKVPIDKYTVHPEYMKNNSRQNDIALIKLSKLVPYTDFIRPICLPSLDITVRPPKNLYMTVAGWGAVNSTVTKSNVLRRVHVPYADFYLCRHQYATMYKTQLGNGQLCAGSKNRDACKGDSGGPLMLLKGSTTELAGIVSFGPQPCGQELPGVYTNVYAYNEWIILTILATIVEDAKSTEMPLVPPVASETPMITERTSITSTSTIHDFNSDLIVFKE